MILIELFERDNKAPPSPEEVRLKTILSVMARRMKKDKLPSMIPWDRLGRVLDKSGVPFSTDQVRAYIEKDFSDKLSIDDRGNIKVVSAGDMDLDTDPTDGLDDFDPMGDLGNPADLGAGIAAGGAAPAPVAPEQPPEPVVDKNVTSQMAQRALKRRT